MRRKSSVGWRDLHDLTLMVNAMRKMGPKGSHGQPGMLGELLDPNDFSGCESLLEAYFLQVKSEPELARYLSLSATRVKLIITRLPAALVAPNFLVCFVQLKSYFSRFPAALLAIFTRLYVCAGGLLDVQTHLVGGPYWRHRRSAEH